MHWKRARAACLTMECCTSGATLWWLLCVKPLRHLYWTYGSHALPSVGCAPPVPVPIAGRAAGVLPPGCGSGSRATGRSHAVGHHGQVCCLLLLGMLWHQVSAEPDDMAFEPDEFPCIPRRGDLGQQGKVYHILHHTLTFCLSEVQAVAACTVQRAAGALCSARRQQVCSAIGPTDGALLCQHAAIPRILGAFGVLYVSILKWSHDVHRDHTLHANASASK